MFNDLNTGGFNVAQGKQRFANLYSNGFPPAWTTAQHGDRFAGEESQFSQALCNASVAGVRGRFNQCVNSGAAASPHLRH